MPAFQESLVTAATLVLQAEPRLLQTIALSLQVSGTASLIGAVVGLTLGAALAVSRFPGQRAVVALLNTLLAMPSVVVGLLVYLLLSRQGPLGEIGRASCRERV